MKKGFLAIATLFATFLTLSAQEAPGSRTLSLQEAVDCAVSYNKTLQVSQMDILYKRKQILEAISRGLPQVNTSLDYSTNFNYSMNLGGNAIKLEDQLSFTARVSQLLFDGQWMVGIRTAKIAKQIAEENVESTELDIRATVHNLYYAILAYRQMEFILEENLRNMETTLKHTENMYDAGVVELTEVDQLRVTTGQLRNQLFSTQRNIELNTNLFKIELGLPVAEQITLSETLESFISGDKYSQLAIEEFDINENISYRQILTQERLQEKMVSLRKWSFAPTISASYSYLEKIVKPSFSMTPKNSGSINLSFPIFSGMQRKASLDMEKINLEKLQTNISLLEDQLNIQEIQCKYDLKNAIDNFILQEENIEVSKKVLANYRQKYEQGVISSLELTQANNNFLTAQTNYTTAVLTLLDAQVSLQKLHNTLK